MSPKTSTPHRRHRGLVVSDKPNKSVVVRVDRTTFHPKYHKQIIRSRRFLVHDERNEFHTGDRVIIEETRPLSSHKRWKVISRI